MAQGLRAEMAVILKWIAAALRLETWTHLAKRLQNVKDKKQSYNQHELSLA
jgi:hypothetical protein